jgi:hypothetical protein
MNDIEAAKRHLDEAIRVLTLEAYRGTNPDDMKPCTDLCSITENLNRVDCAIGPKGESMFARCAQDALEAFTEIKLARRALD